MATATEQMKKGIRGEENGSEPFRSFVDESASAGREYVAAVNAAVLEGLKTSFALQNEGIKAARAVFDASVEAAKGLGGTWTDAITEAQAAATKVVASGLRATENAIDPK